MVKSTTAFLFWTPRILALLYSVFISMFALDVFNEGLGFWQTLGALLLHLIPTAALLLILAIAWRWEWVGGMAYAALGVLFIIWAPEHVRWTVRAVMAGALFLIGVLFLWGWLYRREVRPAP